MRTARFPQLAVRCTWCKAPAGQLCTTPSNGKEQRTFTHDARHITWVVQTATCPDCTAAPRHACFTSPGGFRVPLATPHPERITAADRAHTANHRTPPWPHQPTAATAATAPSAGPGPRPADSSPSTPTPTRPGTPRSGETAPAHSGPAGRPPNSP
ncbi:hypothetical protein GCM10020227_11740 [Streptomyces flavovirens]